MHEVVRAKWKKPINWHGNLVIALTDFNFLYWATTLHWINRKLICCQPIRLRIFLVKIAQILPLSSRCEDSEDAVTNWKWVWARPLNPWVCLTIWSSYAVKHSKNAGDRFDSSVCIYEKSMQEVRLLISKMREIFTNRLRNVSASSASIACAKRCLVKCTILQCIFVLKCWQ